MAERKCGIRHHHGSKEKELMIGVVGAGIGGLSAAIECALNGLEVTVFEAREAAGGKACPIVHQGYTLDPGPSIVILPEIYTDLIQRAGFKPETYLDFIRLETITRIFNQSASKEREPEVFDLPADHSKLLDLARDINPRDATHLEELMAKLNKWAPYIKSKFLLQPVESPLALLDWKLLQFGRELQLGKEFKQIVDGMFQSDVFRALFYGFPSYSGLSYRTKSPSPWFIPYFMLQQGVYVSQGGVASIPNALFQVAQELGVRFEFQNEVVGVASSGSNIVSLQTAQSGMVKVEGVICNQDRGSFAKLLKRNKSSKPSMSYLTLHLGIRNPSFDFATHNLFISSDYKDGFRNLYELQTEANWAVMYLNAPHLDNPECSPEGTGQYFFVSPCPAQMPSFDQKKAEETLLETVESRLHRFHIPLDLDRIEVEIKQSPLVFAERDGNEFGSLFGVHESERVMGMLPGNRDQWIKNLFYVGASVQPGAGMPMACLSGQHGATGLLEQLKG